MRLARLSLAVAALAVLSCSDDPKIREDSPEHLVEDLARALRVHAIEWLDEENAAADGPAGMGAVASQDVTAEVIRYQRLLERGRALCDRWLPPEARRLQVPAEWSAEVRSFAVSLALTEPEDILATVEAASSPTAPRRVTLRVGNDSWSVRMRPVKKSWEFVTGLRRQR